MTFKKGLLKRRFKILERERRLRLKKLTSRTALKLEEGLLSSDLIWQWRKNFFEDKPICLKAFLKRKS